MTTTKELLEKEIKNIIEKNIEFLDIKYDVKDIIDKGNLFLAQNNSYTFLFHEMGREISIKRSDYNHSLRYKKNGKSIFNFYSNRSPGLQLEIHENKENSLEKILIR